MVQQYEQPHGEVEGYCRTVGLKEVSAEATHKVRFDGINPALPMMRNVP